MATTCVYNVFVGAETGLLKGIQIAERSWQNLNAVESANRSREITSLCWGDANKTDLCAGLRDNCVLTFDSSGASAKEDGPFFDATGHIKSIAKYNGRFLTGFSGGTVAVWAGDGDKEDAVTFSTGDNLWAMAQCSTDPSMLATGGKENPLKLWDLNQTGEPVYSAKNVKNDWLNLRVPVWVTKIQFLGDSRKIVTGTGHNQVRVYDSRAQRRPVVDFNFLTYPLTGLSLHPHSENQVLASNTVGDLGLLDLRKKSTVQLYKGFTGGITDIACHTSAPVVVSCSVDRRVRIHHIDTKAMLDSFYVKSRLNCLLLSDEWPDTEGDEKVEVSSKKNVAAEAGDDVTGEADAIWDSLEAVKTKSAAAGHKRKSDIIESASDAVVVVVQESSESKKSKKKQKNKKSSG